MPDTEKTRAWFERPNRPWWGVTWEEYQAGQPKPAAPPRFSPQVKLVVWFFVLGTVLNLIVAFRC